MTKEPPRGSARAGDEAAIARGEKALPEVIWVLDAQLAKGKWLLGIRLHPGGMRIWPGAQRVDKAGFGYSLPKVRAYLDAVQPRAGLPWRAES